MLLCPSTDPLQGLFGPLCTVELLLPLLALKEKENNSVMFLTKAILHPCLVLLSSLLLASCHRGTKLNPSSPSHRDPAGFNGALAGALGMGAARNTARMGSQAFTLL